MKFLPAMLAGAIITSTGFSPAIAADISQPVVSDSRVKTFVYNENEVYTILTQYGYQTNIEFGRGEEVQTISVGDRVSWQIIPAGRRLFIQTLNDEAQTNLTVVTDRRSYQFDLVSTAHRKGNEDRLVYVARFYYPDEDWDQPESVQAAPDLIQPVSETQYNFNYTYAGLDMVAPVKIFDDGASTYFQFPAGQSPRIAKVTPTGQEIPVQASMQGGYLVVPGIAGKYAVHNGNEIVCVFNEQLRGR
ncbi:MAG: TrbG/VirB9 family P-type conjugative transfer protein [Alphaproteobacteria bacterium]|nr:TrbG/VirB9 family P-type conjugative transfer protein [Alphaproteobacteria bacterium]